MDLEKFAQKLESLQNEIDERDIGDFYIIKYDYFNSSLTLAGSLDFGLHHDLEITFNNVSFISLPGSLFKINKIRLGYQDEVKSFFDTTYGYNEGPTICLEDTDFKNKFYVSTNSVDYKLQKVYYYKEENLGPNEKIADWVK